MANLSISITKSSIYEEVAKTTAYLGAKNKLDDGERFFDKASTSPGAGSLSRQATFNVDGHQVTLEFAPNSIRNPFQLPRFSCP